MYRYIYNEHLCDLVGCEIGVNSGHNAVEVLKNLDIKRLYLIDNYKNSPEQKEKMLDNLSPYIDKVRFIFKDSVRGVRQVKENLDFVYIDGDHTLSVVRSDINVYYPKVKSGGVMGGHDYYSNYPGVVRAVNEFVDREGLELMSFDVLRMDGIHEGVDWFVVKP